MSNSLLAFSKELVAAVREHSGAVVAVQGGRRFPSSGVVWRPGVVVTAEHTLRADEDVSVVVDGGKTVAARLAGRDPGTDIAVLRLESADAAPAIQRGGESSVEPGALVLTVGRSANAGPVASMGIIGAVSGPWRTWRGGRLDQYIRLDVGMYPGSSGSAVIDASGIVIGMATSVLSRVAGLAVPAGAIDRVAEELLSKGRVSRSYLGVALQPVQLPEHQRQQEGARGLIVMTVEPGGPAAKAAVLVGDILVALDGATVRDTDDVQNALETHPAGSTLRATLLRGGQRHEVDVPVAERPSREK